MIESAMTLSTRVRALGESIDMHDCALARTILSAERTKLIADMNRAQAREMQRRNSGYMGRY